MAKILEFDKKQFSINGVIPLKRGDDWSLSGQVLEKYANYKAPLDLSKVTSATAFWPHATGGVIAEAFNVIDNLGGLFNMPVPASDTVNVGLEDNTSVYATLQHQDLGLITVETEFAVIEIKDRDFQSS